MSREGAYGPMPWAIGQTDCWPGTAKVMEECGELTQVLGKLIALGTDGIHWDGSDLRVRIAEEVADVYAALDFFCEVNEVHGPFIDSRVADKRALFMRWHQERLLSAMNAAPTLGASS